MRIKELLKEKRMTQQELADKMNVSLSAVKQMVSAESLTTTTLEKIATALDVPMWQIFASPNDIHPQAKTIICPHCQKPIPVEVDVKIKME
jgi:transcriptional regulator with XRE-family HTH domain